MAPIEDELRVHLRSIAAEAQYTSGAAAADDAIRLAQRQRRRTVTSLCAGLVLVGAAAGGLLAWGPGPSGEVAAGATDRPTSTTETTSAATTSGPPELPQDRIGPADPEVGVAYPFSMYTHCGIDTVTFGGRDWRAVDPQPEPERLPGSDGVTNYTGYTSGEMTLVDRDHLRFVITDPQSVAAGQTMEFMPQPTAAQPSPPCA
jgi:hypothetical protein